MRLLYGVPLVVTSIALGVLACVASCASTPRWSSDEAPLDLAVVPPLGEGRVKQIESRNEVRLSGPRVEAKVGDFLVEHDGMVAVISRDDGAVIDFGPAGAGDELIAIQPATFDSMSQMKSRVVFAGAAGPDGHALHVVHRATSLPIVLHSFFTFRGKRLLIESLVVPETASGEGMAVGIGERVAYGNVPAWVEGFGFVRNEAIRQSARFIARDGPGIAYAFGREGDDFFVRVASASLPGFFNAPRTDEIVIASKNAKRRSLLLAASTRSIGDAAAQLWIERGEQRAAIPRGLPASARVEVARCPELGGHREPFARFSPTDAAVVVPLECFEARVWAPGHGPSAWVTLAAVGSLTLPPVGTLAVRATEGSEPVPVRVQVRGIEGTPSADWGEDPDDGAALDTLATETGVAERPLAPGRYRVIVDRGFEYSAHDELVTIRAGERTSVLARLDRVVDTRGFVAADLHLHAIPSMDAPQSLEDRLRGVAAAGVEVAVATDHNRITDYAPTIRALGLERHVARVIGDEITTEDIGFGHFNVFPLEAGSAPLLFERTSPSAIFAEARGRAPLFDANVIQVNHPRMGDIGYFDVMRFDRDDIAAFRRRSPEADLGFDALEVYNGDHYVEIPEVEEVMRDWYALLDSGLHVMATGNSDSHRFSFHEAGVPRTYVEIGDEDLARFDHRGFIASIRAGRGMVSGGPFVRLTVAGQGIGRTVPGGTHEVVVTVDAPPWIDVSEVEIVRRGVVVERITAPEGATPVTELRTRLTLTRGDWIIAIARGRREMSVLRKRGGMPFSFTNPVWVQ